MDSCYPKTLQAYAHGCEVFILTNQFQIIQLFKSLSCPMCYDVTESILLDETESTMKAPFRCWQTQLSCWTLTTKWTPRRPLRLCSSRLWMMMGSRHPTFSGFLVPFPSGGWKCMPWRIPWMIWKRHPTVLKGFLHQLLRSPLACLEKGQYNNSHCIKIYCIKIFIQVWHWPVPHYSRCCP